VTCKFERTYFFIHPQKNKEDTTHIAHIGKEPQAKAKAKAKTKALLKSTDL